MLLLERSGHRLLIRGGEGTYRGFELSISANSAISAELMYPHRADRVSLAYDNQEIESGLQHGSETEDRAVSRFGVIVERD
jgi:hypothetical protein